MDTMSNKEQPSPDKQDFLEHELQVTREAIKSTAADIWNQVPSTDDVAAWTKANPLLAVGIAAGAGVVAGFMVAPSRGGGHSAPRSTGSSMLGSIFGAVAPSLSMAFSEASRTAIAAAVAHFTSQQVAEQNTGDGPGASAGNGHAQGHSAEASSTEAA